MNPNTKIEREKMFYRELLEQIGLTFWDVMQAEIEKRKRTK